MDDALAHLEDGRHEDGEAHEEEDHEAGDALLPHAQELGLLARGRACRLQLQAVDMRDGENGRRHEPRQAHDGAHSYHQRHQQQVQMVAAAFLREARAHQGWG